MRQARGHGPERGETLPALLDGLDPAEHRPHLLQHPPMHRTLGEDELDGVRGGDDPDAAVGLGLYPQADRRLDEDADRAHPGRRTVLPGGLNSAVVHEQPLERSLEHQEHGGLALPLLGDDVPRLVLVDMCDRGPALELRVVEVVEEVDRPKIGGSDGGGAHALARYSWMRDTAIEPSPTALATRLIERARTSPATKTPGTLVSST